MKLIIINTWKWLTDSENSDRENQESNDADQHDNNNTGIKYKKFINNK